MDSEKWLDQQLQNDRLDERSEQAMEWLVRLTAGDADAAVLAEFARWRDRDPRNEKALIAARRLWLLLGVPLQAQSMSSATTESARRHRRQRRRLRPLLATAAALLLAIGFGRQWLHDWRYDQITAVGEQRTMTLADGSTMWLNTDSAVDIAIDAGTRRVRLMRGEAYFDVRKNPALPFVVDAGDGRVEVLGTAFSVRRQDQGVDVIVQRGRVRVSSPGGAPVVVTADRAVRLRRGDPHVQTVAIDAERTLSWRRGWLQFENRPIAEVLQELRRYDPRFVLLDYPRARQLRVNAVIDLARIGEWYDSLEQSLPVSVTRIGPLVLIRARGANTASVEPMVVDRSAG